MAYTFDQIFAADPSNPGNVAANGVVTIFAPGDASQTPLQIMDTSGNPLVNPVTVNANGYGDAFSHATLDRVAWAGGGFSGFFTSYEGLKDEAVAARAAAEEALGGVPARVTEEVAAVAATGAFKGEPGRDGSNVVPTAEAIATEIQTPGTPANTALSATILDRTEPLFAKRRFLTSNAPFAKTTRALNGFQAKGYDPVDRLMWYSNSTDLVTSADHGVTLSTAKALPTGVVATTIKKVLRAGGYIWIGAVDSADGRTKVWRAPVGTYTWSAPLVTMTYLGGLLGPGMNADSSYVYIGDYSDPQGGAHVWRGDVNTGVFTDVTPTGIVRHVHAIAADPYNPGHVWMTTGDSGARLYRSTNYGQTWTLLNSEWQSVQISFTPEWVYLAADSAVASVLVVDRESLDTLVATPTWHYEMAVPGGAASRVVTDLATNTAGTSGIVTSATANFTARDIGRRIEHGRNVDPMAYITGVTNATTATVSSNSWGPAASNITATIFGDQFYDKAFFGAVDPATGVYYCIANDNSGKGTRSGLFVLPGVGEPMQLVQTFNTQIAGEVFIAGGYLHSHEAVRPLVAFA